MIKYKKIAEDKLQKLEEWEIIQVKRQHNVDALARLGVAPYEKEGRWIRVETSPHKSTKST